MIIILKIYQQKSKTLWEKNYESGFELPKNKMLSKRTIIKTVEKVEDPQIHISICNNFINDKSGISEEK